MGKFLLSTLALICSFSALSFSAELELKDVEEKWEINSQVNNSKVSFKLGTELKRCGDEPLIRTFKVDSSVIKDPSIIRIQNTKSAELLENEEKLNKILSPTERIQNGLVKNERFLDGVISRNENGRAGSGILRRIQTPKKSTPTKAGSGAQSPATPAVPQSPGSQNINLKLAIQPEINSLMDLKMKSNIDFYHGRTQIEYIKLAVEALGRIHEKNIVHGDISPYKIGLTTKIEKNKAQRKLLVITGLSYGVKLPGPKDPAPKKLYLDEGGVALGFIPGMTSEVMAGGDRSFKTDWMALLFSFCFAFFGEQFWMSDPIVKKAIALPLTKAGMETAANRISEYNIYRDPRKLMDFYETRSGTFIPVTGSALLMIWDNIANSTDCKGVATKIASELNSFLTNFEAHVSVAIKDAMRKINDLNDDIARQTAKIQRLKFSLI